ncbi:F-box/kelch-repeat protein [Senna tora]|uniref:F-box/kelch-repeat protein n=1 Tax=Senna tora TaxID=362788 RepID=A0A834TEU0_9FABA|nr:F-box/kelch-repeat protein [Senna tora]
MAPSPSLPYIPFEVIASQILPKLDVKTLVLCTSIAKQWYSLIKSPSFVCYHFLHNQRASIFFQICHIERDSLLRRVFRFQETYSLYTQNLLLRRPLANPPFDRFKNNETFFTIVGICKGLVLVIDSNLFSYILWNPSVRKYVLLPRLDQCLERKACLGFGFANDEDFKVVKLVNVHSSLRQAWVCSFASNSWKSVINNNGNNINNNDGNNDNNLVGSCYVCEDRSFLCMNGNIIHWIAKRQVGNFYNFVLTFDLAEEVFGQVPLPEKIRVRSTMSSLSLFETKGCLAVSNIQNGVVPSPIVRVWIMKEYGVAESWSKIIKVQIKELIPRNVLALTNNGEMVIEQRGGQIVKCNPAMATMEELGVGGDKVFGGYLEETLFLLGKGRREDGWREVLVLLRVEVEQLGNPVLVLLRVEVEQLGNPKREKLR